MAILRRQVHTNRQRPARAVAGVTATGTSRISRYPSISTGLSGGTPGLLVEERSGLRRRWPVNAQSSLTHGSRAALRSGLR